MRTMICDQCRRPIADAVFQLKLKPESALTLGPVLSYDLCFHCALLFKSLIQTALTTLPLPTGAEQQTQTKERP